MYILCCYLLIGCCKVEKFVVLIRCDFFLEKNIVCGTNIRFMVAAYDRIVPALLLYYSRSSLQSYCSIYNE